MVMTNTFFSATQAAAAIAGGEVSSRELTAALLERIEDVNPSVNALVELRGEDALREAEQADAALAAGAPLGALHGVPITVKEALNVAGMHTTWGNPEWAHYVADSDATVVTRLREAGAVLVAKSNLAFMLADFAQTTNPLYGKTRNPHDLERAPGGSSGGAAAALAADMTYLDFGSDLAGSIRIPAANCGVYGLRPSSGIVPLSGFQPPGPPRAPNEMSYLSCLGPMARTPQDLRTALRVTAGPDSPTAYSWSLPSARHMRLADYRVGVVLDDPRVPVTDEVGAALSDTTDALARTGARIVPGWPDGVDADDSFETFGLLLNVFLAYAQPGPTDIAFDTFIEHEHRRMAIRAAWQAYHRDVDVFLCPVNFTTAIPHDDQPFEQRTVETSFGPRPYTDQSFWTAHASLPGLPAISAPVGSTTGGLPIGIQIIGPRYEDDTAITFAELLALEVDDGCSRPEVPHSHQR